jgi:hypothetical protein
MIPAIAPGPLPVRRAAGLALAIVLLMGGCTAGVPDLLPRKDLFSVRLGKVEDGIDLFQAKGIKSQRKNRIFMRNGIFFIANGNAGKVMEFSSYGDLITLLYNPQENVRPYSAGQDKAGGRVSNKQVVPYTFQEVGEVAVTRSGTLLVEDRAPQARSVRDPKLGVMLSNVLLRFDKRRQYVDYLGQEGIGGSPLPYVQGLYVTTGDDIVAVCKTPAQWLVFWYNDQGVRRYAVSIDLSTLPMPAPGSPLIPSLVEVRPDPEMPLIYLLIDYYPDGAAASERERRVESRIYTLNLASGSYDAWFSLPYETQDLAGASEFEPKIVQSLHSFLGVTLGGNFLFTNHWADDRYQLTIMDRNGRVMQKRLMAIEDSKLVDMDLHLSFDGVLSAFLGLDDRAQIAWWRADSLIGRTMVFR